MPKHPKQTEHIAIGCSHTRMQHLSVPDRWTTIVRNETGVYFDHDNFSKVGAGLSFLYPRIKRQLRKLGLTDKTKTVLIQKPISIRCPWWGTPEEDLSKGYPGGLGCLSGRRESQRLFSKLTKEEKRRVAGKIYDIEVEYLKKISDLFPKAKVGYYYYWIDEIVCILHYPELVGINKRLSIVAEDLGMTSFGEIINPQDIPGALDDQGDLIFNTKKICKNGWILSRKDIHPGKTYSAAVAKRVIEWLSS